MGFEIAETEKTTFFAITKHELVDWRIDRVGKVEDGLLVKRVSVFEEEMWGHKSHVFLFSLKFISLATEVSFHLLTGVRVLIGARA